MALGWPLPGKWWWTIKIEDLAVDLRRLRNIYAKIILACESVGVKEPRRLPLAAIDGDVRWLVKKSVRMQGYPSVPANDAHGPRRATIDRLSTWGGSEEIFSQLDEALSTAFEAKLIQRHLAKLMRTGADERHLFLVVGVRDLPFSLFSALGFEKDLPAGAPALPDGLTHLWLAPEYGHRVLFGTPAGWVETRDIRPFLAADDHIR
jgi:hypothetical protein